MKKLLCISIAVLFISNTLLADNPPCDNVLSACQDLVAAQDLSIKSLKKQVLILEDKLADETPSLVPGWLYFVGGALIGGMVVHEVHK